MHANPGDAEIARLRAQLAEAEAGGRALLDRLRTAERERDELARLAGEAVAAVGLKPEEVQAQQALIAERDAALARVAKLEALLTEACEYLLAGCDLIDEYLTGRCDDNGDEIGTEVERQFVEQVLAASRADEPFAPPPDVPADEKGGTDG